MIDILLAHVPGREGIARVIEASGVRKKHAKRKTTKLGQDFLAGACIHPHTC